MVLIKISIFVICEIIQKKIMINIKKRETIISLRKLYMILNGINIEGLNDTLREKIRNFPLHSKRLAILSILDKDRMLFLKIKALTDKSIDRLEHIKDVILMMREYVQVGEVEKKKFGEVMTPTDLVSDMLKTLPEDVWSNPDLKWFDPANGSGQFPVIVIYKLMEGLKDWEPDTEKRYKHIIENMIYTCELQAKNVFQWLCIVDPFDEYLTNVYLGSFLDEKFDFHMKEIWKVDSFDIILGNPPFQSYTSGPKSVKLHFKFINKSLKFINDNSYILFVTPKNSLLFLNGIELNQEKISKKVGIHKINIDNVEKYFNGIGTDFCYFLFSNREVDMTNVNNEYNIQLKFENIFPYDLNPVTISILNKTLNGNQNEMCL
jgi:hypothetical protein